MIKRIEETGIKQADDRDDGWEKDTINDDAEVVKIPVEGSIEGILVDKFQSTKYNAGVYKIKVKNDETPKVLLGTTILDKLMANKEIGDELKITRLENTVNRKGQQVQNWETYHKKKE